MASPGYLLDLGNYADHPQFEMGWIFCNLEITMVSGTADKAKGVAKEVAGKVTGDKRTEGKGKADQVKGKAKDAAENVSESAKGVKDSLKKK